MSGNRWTVVYFCVLGGLIAWVIVVAIHALPQQVAPAPARLPAGPVFVGIRPDFCSGPDDDRFVEWTSADGVVVTIHCERPGGSA